MSSIDTCEHGSQAPRKVLEALPPSRAETTTDRCVVCAYAAGAGTSLRAPGPFDPAKVLEAIRAHREHLDRTRATFPHVPATMVGQSVFPTAPYYFTRGHHVVFQFDPPLDDSTARALHESGQWINENFVVRLCAVLDSHKVTGKSIENRKDLPGYPELRLARRLRNVFAHGSGRCDPANSDHRKLRADIVAHFNLVEGECQSGWFPLPVAKVLVKLAEGCEQYVVALAATRPTI